MVFTELAHRRRGRTRREWTRCVNLGEVDALRGPCGLVVAVAVAVAVRVGAAARYKQEVPLHVGYRDPALLSTTPGLALVV
jgi:hypothetical protein